MPQIAKREGGPIWSWSRVDMLNVTWSTPLSKAERCLIILVLRFELELALQYYLLPSAV